MSIALLGKARVLNGTSGNLTVVPVPVETLVNARLLCFIHSIGSTTGQVITDPEGFIKLDELADGSNSKGALYYRDADGTEATSYTWTWTNNGRNAGYMLAYSGVDLSAPPIFSKKTDGAANTSITTTAVNVAAAGWLVAAVLGRTSVAGATVTWSSSTGTDAERYDEQTAAGSNELSAAIYDSGTPEAGGNLSRTLTGVFSSGGLRMVGWGVALNPLGGGDPVPPGTNPWSHVGVPHR